MVLENTKYFLSIVNLCWLSQSLTLRLNQSLFRYNTTLSHCTHLMILNISRPFIDIMCLALKDNRWISENYIKN